MQLIEVTNKKTAKVFLDVPRKLYRDDPNWICPLDNMVEAVFDRKKNVFFTHGDAIRWILLDEKNNPTGRVAAFINKKKAYNYNQPTGGMGFFECINDKEAAETLFNACIKWLKERGMEAMDGPINFGENDNFWGLLVEGFMPPSFGMNYNFPYYKKFFEDFGFKSYFEQVTNHLDLTVPFPERFWKIANWIRKRPGYTYKHFKFKDAEKFVEDLKTVYDKAWVYHENFTPINKKDVWESFKKAKPIIIEEFIWYVYYNGEPVAFLVMLPDANQIFKHLNGKLHLINKLRFFLLKMRKVYTQTRITVMGVVPEHQKKGIESAIFWHMDKVMPKWPKIETIELSWVGDFNPKMRALHDAVGGKFVKKHITYRKLFNNTADNPRYETIPVDTKENGKAKKGR